MTDIHLAGLLFPALSSDPLFFACPGSVQLNWFFFCFVLFSFCFQFLCLRGALRLPSCSFCLSIAAALRGQHSRVTRTWPLETFLCHKGTWVKFFFCPCTGCSHALCVPVARYCVRVYKRHVSLTSAVRREKDVKLVWRVRRKDFGWKQAPAPDNSPLEVVCSFNPVLLLWPLRMERRGNGAHAPAKKGAQILYQFCLILPRKEM